MPRIYLWLQPNREATEDVRCPHRPLRPVRPTDKNREYGWNGMPSMPRARLNFGEGLQKMDDGEGSKISGAPAEES